MESRSKYWSLLGSLLKQPAFTAAEALTLGVPRHALAYLVRRGALERLTRGVYRSSSYESAMTPAMEDLITTASTIPNAVICLVSALYYYEMTDEIMRRYWIAIPNKQRAPRRPHVKATRMRNVRLGRVYIQINSRKVAIFDRERCIIDAFRHLTEEMAIKALRAYLYDETRKPNLDKLARYAKILHVNIRPYVVAFTT